MVLACETTQREKRHLFLAVIEYNLISKLIRIMMDITVIDSPKLRPRMVFLMTCVLKIILVQLQF